MLLALSAARLSWSEPYQDSLGAGGGGGGALPCPVHVGTACGLACAPGALPLRPGTGGGATLAGTGPAGGKLVPP
eukprot:16198112-Heterocapsa_arctica.AAC.1